MYNTDYERDAARCGGNGEGSCTVYLYINGSGVLI